MKTRVAVPVKGMSCRVMRRTVMSGALCIIPGDRLEPALEHHSGLIKARIRQRPEDKLYMRPNLSRIYHIDFNV